jgi:hypothetical protein
VNYYKEVKRTEVLKTYYEASGKIDEHNRHRQYTLRLEKVWNTRKWQTRILTSMLGTSAVDAYLICSFLEIGEYQQEQEQATDGMETQPQGKLAAFIGKLVSQLDPRTTEPRNDTPLPPAVGACCLVRIGTKRTLTTGRSYAAQKTEEMQDVHQAQAPRQGWHCTPHCMAMLCPS